MSRKMNQDSKKFTWIVVTFAVSLAVVFWVWPTYFNSPDLSSESGTTLVAEQSGHLDVEGAYQKRQAGAFLLDVRTQEEWNAGHIPGATLIPLDQLSARAGELPEDQEIVIYCRSGNRSAQALDLLTTAGFSGVYSMEGGINDWIAAGYGITTGD